MSTSEIEDFWGSASPPVVAVWFDDRSGFSNYFCLMASGALSVHLDSAAGAGLQVLADALAYFRR